jgi:hypothetical protein
MLLNLQLDDLARQNQQFTMQSLAVEFAEDFAALEDEQRPAKAQQDPSTNKLMCLQDCLFELACESVIYSLCGQTSSRGGWQTSFRAAKEAKKPRIGKTSYLHIGLKRFSATQEGRDNITGRPSAPEDNPFKKRGKPHTERTKVLESKKRGTPAEV